MLHKIARTVHLIVHIIIYSILYIYIYHSITHKSFYTVIHLITSTSITMTNFLNFTDQIARSNLQSLSALILIFFFQINSD